MIDSFTAKAQLLLSIMFLLGLFTVIILFMAGYSKIPDGMKEIFSGLVALLSAGGLMILQFWFSRSRGLNANA